MARKKHRPQRARIGVQKGATFSRWTPEEHERFLSGLSTHGRQWVEVAKVVRTRTSEQVSSHAWNYFKQLEREGKGHLILPKLGQGGRPPKVRTEEAHHHQQEPTLASASTSSNTICTAGDHDDSTSGIESTPPASPFEEENSGGGSVGTLFEDAAPAPSEGRAEDLDSDAIKKQLYVDLVYIDSSQEWGRYD